MQSKSPKSIVSVSLLLRDTDKYQSARVAQLTRWQKREKLWKYLLYFEDERHNSETLIACLGDNKCQLHRVLLQI